MQIMQTRSLHEDIYKLLDDTRTHLLLEPYYKKYLPPVTKWEKLRTQRVSEKICQEVVGISRATYYRYKKVLKDLDKEILPPTRRPWKVNKPKWGEVEKQLVLKIRQENPTYGKEKIAIIIERDFGTIIRESTVGRILSVLFEKGLVQKSPSFIRKKRKRNFQKGHAKPWTYKDYNKIELGERVQIDHMTVVKNGVRCKHFQAWERCSKFIEAQVYSNAKSQSAKKFLLNFIEKAPFKIRSIQVDGGSEFRAEFEEACKELGIPLIVLPPAKPTYNGGVERGNRTFREEFYDRDDWGDDSIQGVRDLLKKAIYKYNSYRPHKSLKGLTPMQYIQNNLSETNSVSYHMN